MHWHPAMFTIKASRCSCRWRRSTHGALTCDGGHALENTRKEAALLVVHSAQHGARVARVVRLRRLVLAAGMEELDREFPEGHPERVAAAHRLMVKLGLVAQEEAGEGGGAAR